MKRLPAKLDLYLENQARLVNYATPIVGDRGRAEEVVQEAFIRFARDEAPEAERPVGYLFRIVRNLALDVIRRRAREQESEAEPDWWMMPAPTRTPEEDVLHAERLTVLAAGLAAMPPAMRRAVEMNRFAGATLTEIAADLSVSIPTAHRLVRNGLAQLARVLGDQDSVS